MSIETDSKESLIQEILQLQIVNSDLSKKHSQLLNHKCELLNISNGLKQQIQDRGEKEILSIDNERDFISQKSAHDEEVIQISFQTKLDGVLKEKEELQRKLEAESEFISRHLKERHAKIRQRTLELRSELLAKSNKNSTSNEDITSTDLQDTTEKNDPSTKDEILLKKKIQDIQKYLDETSKRILDSRHEIETLTQKCQRYSKVLSSWSKHRSNMNEDIQNSRFRRQSSVTKHPKLLPDV